jgi:hypothetical protein
MAGNTEHTYYGGNQSGDSGVKHGEIHQLVVRNAASGQMQYNPLIDGTVLRSVPLYLRKLGVDDPELFNPLAYADDVPTFAQIVLPYLEAAAEYDENETYTARRLAVSGNKLYVSIAPTTGQFDPSKWMQIHNLDELYASCVTAETSDSSAFDGNTKIATGISGGRLKVNLASRLWTWIKNQISTVLGLTATKVENYDSHLSDTNNPHSVTAAQVGLGNVGNFKAVSTVAGQDLNSTEQSNARTNIGAGTYTKAANGIPKTDLASGVQTSLGLADTAYQLPSTGIPSTDLASAVQTSLGKADTALQHSDVASSVTGGDTTHVPTADAVFNALADGTPVTQIGSTNVDLNDYKGGSTVKFYRWSASQATRIANNPFSDASFLAVYPQVGADGFSRQVCYRRGTQTIATRDFIDSTLGWTPWREIALDTGSYANMSVGIANYLKNNSNSSGTSFNDFNTKLNTSKYQATDAGQPNAPESSEYYNVYTALGGSLDYNTQLAIKCGRTATKTGMYFRSKSIGVYTGWKEVIYNTNVGAQVGSATRPVYVGSDGSVKECNAIATSNSVWGAHGKKFTIWSNTNAQGKTSQEVVSLSGVGSALDTEIVVGVREGTAYNKASLEVNLRKASGVNASATAVSGVVQYGANGANINASMSSGDNNIGLNDFIVFSSSSQYVNIEYRISLKNSSGNIVAHIRLWVYLVYTPEGGGNQPKLELYDASVEVT